MGNFRESFINVFEERFKEDLDSSIRIMLDVSFELDILDIIHLLQCIYEYRAFLKFKYSKENKDE